MEYFVIIWTLIRKVFELWKIRITHSEESSRIGVDRRAPGRTGPPRSVLSRLPVLVVLAVLLALLRALVVVLELAVLGGELPGCVALRGAQVEVTGLL